LAVSKARLALMQQQDTVVRIPEKIEGLRNLADEESVALLASLVVEARRAGPDIVAARLDRYANES
jgi:hypothetical protein